MTVRLRPPAGSGQEMRDVVRQTNEALQRIADPLDPVKLPDFALVADLPDASLYRACQVYVEAITMTAFSDGTNWRRSDTGAVL